MKRKNGTIFAIKKYAIHDGPHLRTTVFFKGCPLSCWWCHNPEGMKPKIEMVTDFSKCIGCESCIDGCEGGALRLIGQKIEKQEQKCTGCNNCLEICPTMVFSTTGWISPVKKIMEEIRKELPFYDQSGGGVTFSGGEPLMQPLFLHELLDECKKIGIHRTVDTSCFAPRQTVRETAAKTDLFLIDLKHMDDNSHRTYTGVSNKPILDNIRMLSEMNSDLRIRIPLIPTVNDDEENIRRSAEFLSSLNTKVEVDLLEYHQSAIAKYKKMQKKYPGAKLPEKNPAITDRSKNILESYGLKTGIGG